MAPRPVAKNSDGTSVLNHLLSAISSLFKSKKNFFPNFSGRDRRHEAKGLGDPISSCSPNHYTRGAYRARKFALGKNPGSEEDR